MTSIRVSALVFINDDLEVLTVRKRGTEGFMLPGGKPEAGESPAQTALREVEEELGLPLSEEQLFFLGQFQAQALNEPGQEVVADVFLAQNVQLAFSDIRPRAEIAQLRWVHPKKGKLDKQAPLNTQAIFPALLETIEDYSRIESLAVFCGSSSGNNPAYTRAAQELGVLLAQEEITLIYGGANIGLMGEAANACLDGEGQVIGVMPDFMVEKERAHPELEVLEKVDTMHQRKARMAELADAFVALPGGPGTLEEFFEVWTWRYLGLHSKPLALLNTAGYWNSLLASLRQMQQEGFVSDSYFENLIVADSPAELLAALNSAR